MYARTAYTQDGTKPEQNHPMRVMRFLLKSRLGASGVQSTLNSRGIDTRNDVIPPISRARNIEYSRPRTSRLIDRY